MRPPNTRNGGNKTSLVLFFFLVSFTTGSTRFNRCADLTFRDYRLFIHQSHSSFRIAHLTHISRQLLLLGAFRPWTVYCTWRTVQEEVERQYQVIRLDRLFFQDLACFPKSLLFFVSIATPIWLMVASVSFLLLCFIFSYFFLSSPLRASRLLSRFVRWLVSVNPYRTTAANQ